MKLKDLIESTHWFSVELILLELYPDTKNMIEDHKKAYEKMKLIEPKSCEMEIVLTEYQDNYDNQITTYVDVSGKNLNENKSESYALEFTEWKKWLGMELADETIKKFTELEIIVHCLYEMTFIDYEESEIQEQFNNIKNIADEYKKMIEENRNDELMKQLKKKIRS